MHPTFDINWLLAQVTELQHRLLADDDVVVVCDVDEIIAPDPASATPDLGTCLDRLDVKLRSLDFRQASDRRHPGDDWAHRTPLAQRRPIVANQIPDHTRSHTNSRCSQRSCDKVTPMRKPFAVLLAATVLFVPVACSSESSDNTSALAPDTATPGCDDRDVRACLLPWPSDRYTVPDATTATGVRVAIPADAVPNNANGTPIDVTDQNLGDGFSPATSILVSVPGVDLAASGVATADDIGSSLDDDAPIVLTDLDTGERWPYWATLDARTEPGDELLAITPAVALTESHRYEVTINNLVTSNNTAVERPLPMQWSFPVASADSLSGRLRSMVTNTEDLVPGFTVESVDNSSNPAVIRGTFELPNFLDNDGGPGGKFVLDDNGLPTVNTTQPTWDAPFICLVGTEAESRPTVVYGHGLLGGAEETLSLSSISTLGGLNACGTDYVGMSRNDIPTVLNILGDLSGFAALADRLQQSQLAFVLLGRLVNDPDGFVSDPAFQIDGTPLLEADGAVFVGNSQDGILGGAASAVNNEWSRVVLGVPGLGYNVMLPRSSNWPRFEEVLNPAYPNAVDRALAVELIQLLWDRGENAGYAQHLTSDPYPGISPKTVLLVEAFGDHQVANLATEKLARTIGAAVSTDALASGRATATDPLWGIASVPSFPTTMSVLSVWDFGTPAPPITNLPPLPPDYGNDPHGAGSSETGVLLQAITFLVTGEIIDPCGGGPCRGRQIDQ